MSPLVETATSSNDNEHAEAAGGDVTPNNNLCFQKSRGRRLARLLQRLNQSIWLVHCDSVDLEEKNLWAEPQVPPFRVWVSQPAFKDNPALPNIFLFLTKVVSPRVRCHQLCSATCRPRRSRNSFEKCVKLHPSSESLFFPLCQRVSVSASCCIWPLFQLPPSNLLLLQSLWASISPNESYFCTCRWRAHVKLRSTELCCPREQLLFMEWVIRLSLLVACGLYFLLLLFPPPILSTELRVNASHPFPCGWGPSVCDTLAGEYMGEFALIWVKKETKKKHVELLELEDSAQSESVWNCLFCIFTFVFPVILRKHEFVHVCPCVWCLSTRQGGWFISARGHMRERNNI